MSGTAGAQETEEFAALLRELKDRSGLSYGALAKRLHMSTSTLHRYCNGTAVPNEYASVERLARACRATPQELVDLHRRWILADEARRRRADRAAAARAGAGDVTAGPDPAGAAAHGDGPADADPAAGSAPDSTAPGSAGPRTDPGPGTAPAADMGGAGATAPYEKARHGDGHEPDAPVEVAAAAGPVPRPRRRTALIASAAAAAVLATVVLVVHQPSDGPDDARDRQAAGVTTADGTPDAEKPAASPPSSRPSRTPPASASATKTATGAAQDGKKQGAAPEPTGGGDTAAPLHVDTTPYVYQSPCSQHFLVDSEPEQVGPPANEADAPRWAAAYGAVSSDEQQVALTVQGTGAETVVLKELHVRVVSKGAPLAWNDYSMGVGCGGNVSTKSFDVDLDEGSPAVAVRNGQRPFPYSVSESDPEVFYVTARTRAHDVRWYLSLDWSSGSRSGTVRIDNEGLPFRTSADAGRPGYDYPLGGNDWIEREG